MPAVLGIHLVLNINMFRFSVVSMLNALGFLFVWMSE